MNSGLQDNSFRLIVDLGNTRAKLAVYEDEQLVLLETAENPDPEKLKALLPVQFIPSGAIISSVAGDPGPYMKALGNFRWINLDYDTPLPFTNHYLTPETLGRDRIAAVAGARHLFPGSDLLVIDMGTAITFDFINGQGEYKGGAISPGLTTRFRALHNFTKRLPLLNPVEINYLTGRTTDESILSGVINGIRAETDGIIEEYLHLYPQLKIILSGGDMFYFEKKLKNNIFATPNLVITGLKQILDYNLEK